MRGLAMQPQLFLAAVKCHCRTRHLRSRRRESVSRQRTVMSRPRTFMCASQTFATRSPSSPRRAHAPDESLVTLAKRLDVPECRDRRFHAAGAISPRNMWAVGRLFAGFHTTQGGWRREGCRSSSGPPCSVTHTQAALSRSQLVGGIYLQRFCLGRAGFAATLRLKVPSGAAIAASQCRSAQLLPC